ncbi:MAG: T9SS type A sorting domain-containing protein [Chitinophagaceae bacterium]|nr:T9SS type A sorting domain-containing protein [Chitinophagaceae bacterium]
MKTWVAILFILLSQLVNAAIITSAGTDNWGTGSTWVGGNVPASGDDVVITGTHIVTINGVFTCNSLEIGQGANSTAQILFSGTNPQLTVTTYVNVGETSGGNNRTGRLTFASDATLICGTVLTLYQNISGAIKCEIIMTAGGLLKTGSLALGTGATTPTWTPGSGTLEMTATNTLPATVFTSFNNLNINSATTTTSGVSFSVGGTITVNGTFKPGAAAHVFSGAGTITGSGTAQVTRTTATADFITQYSISNKTLTNLTVDYFATGAQSVNALNYFNLTISGARSTNSVTLANSGTIRVSGTFTPSASFSSGNYVLTSSTVNFNGSSAQNIPSFTFNNLTVSTSSKTATGVINVNGIFTLNSSVLTTTSTNLLILNDNATATGASYTAYVNGPVRKIGNDAFTFPVGKSGTGYMLIGISAPSVVTDAYTAEYMRSPGTALGSITAAGLNFISNCDYWNLDRTTGSSTLNVTLSWNGYSNCNAAAYVTDLTTLTIAHFNGTSWDTHGKNSTTGNVSSGTITHNGVSVFSPFTLGSTGATSNPLQVKFTSITASLQQGGVRVDWTNIAETEINHYEIERSLNAIQFIRVSQQHATVNNGNKASYDWLDTSPLNGSVFYRIRAVGTDGNVNYSSTVKIDPEGHSTLTIYPNPVEGNRLVLKMSASAKGKYQVQVYDMTGRNIHSQAFEYNGGSLSQVINLPSNTKPGVYSLRITDSNQSQVKTFIVK